MTALLIAYDLNIETSRKVAKFIEESYSSRVQLAESAYAILTDDEIPAQVCQRLANVLKGGGQFYAFTLDKGWEGQGPPSVDKWLEDNVPK